MCKHFFQIIPKLRACRDPMGNFPPLDTAHYFGHTQLLRAPEKIFGRARIYHPPPYKCSGDGPGSRQNCPKKPSRSFGSDGYQYIEFLQAQLYQNLDAPTAVANLRSRRRLLDSFNSNSRVRKAD
ncbi:hypothetical protein J6590_045814 [Homalodisca vitripennis]|nr:hypothetical protein J6590_045814 [Homalodisca vitripennis]